MSSFRIAALFHSGLASFQLTIELPGVSQKQSCHQLDELFVSSDDFHLLHKFSTIFRDCSPDPRRISYSRQRFIQYFDCFKVCHHLSLQLHCQNISLKIIMIYDCDIKICTLLISSASGCLQREIESIYFYAQKLSHDITLHCSSWNMICSPFLLRNLIHSPRSKFSNIIKA